MLCRKNSINFQSNAPCTCTLCTFWASGIALKTPSGGHASLGTTQQSQEVTLNNIGILIFHFFVSATDNSVNQGMAVPARY